MSEESEWRADVDALAFKPDGHAGQCFVHRRAFGTLLAFDAGPEDCQRFFKANRAVFEQAALSKLAQGAAAPHTNFHLTSRDLERTARIYAAP